MKKTLFAASALALGLAIITSLSAQAKVKEGSAFPTAKLPMLQGSGTMDLNTLKGKVVIYDFWASWCEPCKIELPALNKMYKKYKAQGLVVIGINMDEKPDDARAFLKEHPITVPLLADGKAQVLAKQLEIDKMPTSFIVGKDGKVAERHEAYREGDDKKIEAQIKALLAKK